MAKLVRANLPTLKKTASYYVVHVTVAAGVAYAVTGNLLLSLTLSLLEPAIQAIAFFFHEKAWQHWGGRAAATPAAMGTSAGTGAACSIGAGLACMEPRDQNRCGNHGGYYRKAAYPGNLPTYSG